MCLIRGEILNKTNCDTILLRIAKWMLQGKFIRNQSNFTYLKISVINYSNNKNYETAYFIFFSYRQRKIFNKWKKKENKICMYGSELRYVFRITHVRSIKILSWLRGFPTENANFRIFLCLLVPKIDAKSV